MRIRTCVILKILLHYFRACYQKRNEFMVDHSNLVIAVWNGKKSGTKNTIDYANRHGIKVINVLNTEKCDYNP